MIVCQQQIFRKETKNIIQSNSNGRQNGTTFRTSVQEKKNYFQLKISKYKNYLSENLGSMKLTYTSMQDCARAL